MTRLYPSSIMSTARYSVLTSSCTCGCFSANSAASLPMAICQNSKGARIRSLPRGVLPRAAIAAAASSISVSWISAVTLPDLQPIPETMANLFRASHGNAGEIDRRRQPRAWGLRGLLVGSVSQKVVQHVDCSG